MEVKINSKIFILSPWYKTGGVECLHQLADLLKKKGFHSGIVYPSIHKKILYPQYSYDVFPKIEDNRKNILIIPESMPKEIYKYKKIRKAIWWLSFDKAPLEEYLFLFNRFFYFLNRALRRIFGNPHKKITKYLFDKKKTLLKEFYNIDHFCQSNYVKEKLKNKGIKNLEMLEDYIYLEKKTRKTKKQKKENSVCYNPKKGFSYTKKIMKLNPAIQFIPLINMTKEELYNQLKKSKIYTDFGYHPGKDKIPREAALNDCIIITNTKGSAGNLRDVPSKYKIKEGDSLEKASKIIKDCIKEYPERIKEFANYKRFVLRGKKNMENQISKIFKFKNKKKRFLIRTS